MNISEFKAQVPGAAQIYLQPTGWCGPNNAQPGSVLKVAGLPVWANSVRLIARDYGGRLIDRHICVNTLRRLAAEDETTRLKASLERLEAARSTWVCGDKQVAFHRTNVMAIVNATPDSFSDGNDHLDPVEALTHIANIAQSADLIDIGGESTRPGSTTVWDDEEIARVCPIIEGACAAGQIVSIDTRKAAVMRAAHASGAVIINDVSALQFDPDALSTASRLKCPVVLMHSVADPQTMQDNPSYEDVVLDVYDALEARIHACEAVGIPRDRIAVDPGIGFGKTVRHNLALINDLSIFHGLGCPLLLGVSRKRFIGALAREDNPKQRGPGSIAAAIAGLVQGVHILRVHDVHETRQALDVLSGLSDGKLLPPD